MSMLSEIEEHINNLSVDDQLLLIERVSQRLRKSMTGKTGVSDDLSEMASDPEIQKEISDIENELVDVVANHIGSNAPILSDQALSREAIYANHP